MPRTVQLGEIAQLIRSKNAGPFLLTLDVLFDNPERYAAVKRSGILTGSTIARLYGVPEEEVRILAYDPGLALKVTMPRRITSGSPFDGDVYGAQQHAQLIGLAFPADDE